MSFVVTINMPIRNANSDDFDAVQALYEQLLAFEKTIDNAIDAEFSYSPDGAEYIKNITSLAPGHFAVVYEQDGEILGYASLRDIPEIEYAYRVGAKIAQIQTLSVDQDNRDSGIGRALINECTRIAKINNYTHVKINAMVGNDRANHLYKSLGFDERVVSYEMEL